MDAPKSEIILYQTEDHQTRVQVRLEGQTAWLTQAQMAQLFQRERSVITKHIRNIFSEGELAEESACAKYAHAATDGKTYQTVYYNLEVVISVGYRVKSLRGTQFRVWATQRLKEYLVKGFVMDDERLKNPGPGAPDYFDELLERIRDIRTSEKRMYLKVREIFALAADYEPDTAQTQGFFQIIQNKLHWAVTRKTAAELIHERADHEKPNMGLTAWKGAKVRKTDVTVAKNYLKENEIAELNRIVTMYLDFAEDQARRRKVLYSRDWRQKLDAFLRFNEREILDHPGRVAKEVADRLALDEYEKFSARQAMVEAETDTFDTVAKKIMKRGKKK